MLNFSGWSCSYKNGALLSKFQPGVLNPFVLICGCLLYVNLLPLLLQVYVEPLSKPDLLFITEALYPQIDHNILEKMVTFNQKVPLYVLFFFKKYLTFFTFILGEAQENVKCCRNMSRTQVFLLLFYVHPNFQECFITILTERMFSSFRNLCEKEEKKITWSCKLFLCLSCHYVNSFFGSVVFLS